MRAFRLTPLFMLLVSSFAWVQPTSTFLIRVEDAARRADLQVRYFLTGGFGGCGGYESKPVGKDGFLISTEYEGKPAQTLNSLWK